MFAVNKLNPSRVSKIIYGNVYFLMDGENILKPSFFARRMNFRNSLDFLKFFSFILNLNHLRS